MPATATGRSTKGAARRVEILNAAYRVLAAEGYSSTSLRAIAREVGMEPAHVLYYFGSRENLLCEVIERWDADSAALIADEDQDGLESFVRAIQHNLQIHGIVHLYLSFAAEAVDPDHAAHDFFRERFDRTCADLARAVRERQAAGTVRAELDPERTARMLIALADGLQLQALVDPTVDAPGDLEAIVAELAPAPARTEPAA